MPKDQDKGFTRPTIVGGQPSARNNRASEVPRGMEALIKKASVDSEFRQELLEKRADAAQDIDLELTPGEAGMLNSIPQAQIEQIIEKTTVPKEHRRVFLGKVGAAMIAALSLELYSCVPLGITSEMPKGSKRDRSDPRPVKGIRPEDPLKRRRAKPEVRLNTGKRLLEVSAVDTDSNSVFVPVRYECPFEKGTLQIFFADEDRNWSRAVLCRPDLVFVAKGKGETAFQSTGKGGTTEWLMVHLHNSDKKCEGDPSHVANLLKEYGPHEYLDRDCTVWRIVKFHKIWQPKV